LLSSGWEREVIYTYVFDQGSKAKEVESLDVGASLYSRAERISLLVSFPSIIELNNSAISIPWIGIQSQTYETPGIILDVDLINVDDAQ
jgi:hypothetical protein